MRRRSGLNFGKQRKKFNMPLFVEIISWIAEIAIVIGIAFVVIFFFGFRTSVVGQAMTSTLENGDQILVNRFVYMVGHPKQNDIVVFFPNGNEKSHYYIRRVIACPGDKVQIKDGAVYVNGKAYQEVNLDVAAIEDAGLAAEEITVDKNEYFVLGDNRNNSEDSRQANIGNVKKEYIEGKVWFRLGSFKKLGTVK